MTDLLGQPTPAEGAALNAATVVLLRDGGGGVECLMLRKTERQTFGGLWVFPGGRVEDGEGSGLAGARRAAVREAAEETGLALRAGDLVPLSHWVPPPEAPKRYLTWFFLAGLDQGAPDVVVDGNEIGDHLWVRPEEAFAAHDRGDVRLLPPTWLTLRWLEGHRDVPAALEAAVAGPVQHFSTRIVDRAGVLVALWSPDVAYPAGEGDQPGSLDVPGPRHRLHMDPTGWRYERS